MAQLVPYLTFNGNCREAMTFYKECLGGKLTIQSVKDTPMAGQMPPEAQNNIMHSSLIKGTLTLMASDMMGGPKGVVHGNSITLMLNCDSEQEIKSAFARLSAGGKVRSELKTEFWGSTFGDLEDKFGLRWMLNFDKPPA
jgi:PhnB protein